MRLGPREKTSNVKNKGSCDGHKDSSGFTTRIQIVDDDDEDNMGTITPAVGEDPPPENRLLHEPHAQVEDQGVEDQPVPAEPQPPDPGPPHRNPTRTRKPPSVMDFPLVIKSPGTDSF